MGEPPMWWWRSATAWKHVGNIPDNDPPRRGSIDLIYHASDLPPFLPGRRVPASNIFAKDQLVYWSLGHRSFPNRIESVVLPGLDGSRREGWRGCHAHPTAKRRRVSGLGIQNQRHSSGD